MAAHAVADGVDRVATLAARRHLPASGLAFATVMAGTSTAVGAWSAARLLADRG